MNNILDQIAASKRYGEFHPKNVQDLFALRLAQKLDDEGAARHYSELAERYSEQRLLNVYRRITAQTDGPRDLARRFHVELDKGNGHGNGSGAQPARMAAFKVERRSVAVAVFNGEHLDYTQVRQLSSNREKAEASATGFIRWICANFEMESAALESMPVESDIQRAEITRSIIAELRDSAVMIWEVSKPQLLHAFGSPAPRSRKELREVIQGIWPILDGNTGVLDAAALGLYVHCERLFLH